MGIARANTARQRAATRITAGLATNPKTLVPFATAQKAVAEDSGVSAQSARKYLRDAVQAGWLVEVKPRQDWDITHALPGSMEWPTLDLVVYADHSGDRYWVTTSKPYGRTPAALTFLMTPERRDELAATYKAEAEAIAAKAEQEEKAKEDADRAEALRRDPEMVALLDRLAALLPESDVRARPRRNSDTVMPVVTISRQDTAAFKAFLQAAFTKEN